MLSLPDDLLQQKFAQVAHKVEPQGQLMRTWTFKGGLSAQMTGLEIALPANRTRKVVVRQPGTRVFQRNPDAAAAEYQILQIVQGAGVVTPAPCLLDQSGEIFDQPYLVMEYVEGEPDYAPADVIDCVVQMAEQLARLHRVHPLANGEGATVAGSGEIRLDLSFLPSQTERLARLLHVRPAQLDETLGEPRIRDVLEAVWPLPSQHTPVLIHGDFWPGNLLWRDGELVAVVDWEDAEVGNPMADIAISRLDTLMIFGCKAMDAFTNRYQALSALDFGYLPYWDLMAALRPAGHMAEWAAGWPALGRDDITEEHMQAGHRWFVRQAMQRIREIRS